ncbi:hypothetical protein [Haloarcula onubensis]|uniref:Small CPxCG-related zinc finger protein n=1 Tax=Haloarcula onubensis TaxID=2950539 RepID=A0ABU2FKD6_9EURY|nr:hypothetical protein [Halomicroarcula sp. S3CR25-11]MDS0281202.1 hypothetical protein [Halomicroarcula sp. S3CR25-11]
MVAAMTCPDCGADIADADDLVAGRRVHRLTVRDDGTVVVDLANTVTLWHCAHCDLAVGVS